MSTWAKGVPFNSMAFMALEENEMVPTDMLDRVNFTGPPASEHEEWPGLPDGEATAGAFIASFRGKLPLACASPLILPFDKWFDSNTPYHSAVETADQGSVVKSTPGREAKDGSLRRSGANCRSRASTYFVLVARSKAPLSESAYIATTQPAVCTAAPHSLHSQ